ncbi:MAG: hypothetical protein H0T51_08315, partial [Pirellulales bacterium]|nr:hypothetical protein [Pirellulales bacterium]
GGGQDSVNIHDAKFGNVKVFTGDTFGNGANDADVVRLQRVRTSGAVTVNTGAGADIVGVYSSTIGDPTGADDLSITAGFAGLPGESDADAVFIQSSAVFGNTTVNTGASADYVSVQNSNFGDSEFDAVVIDAGAGSDTVELGVPNRQGQISGPVQLAGSLSVLADSFANSDAESGNDVVRMHSVFADFDIGANLRSGNDRLELTNVHGRFLTFHGEKGNDTMIMVEAEARETLFALMGENDDLLDMTGVGAKRLEADGGAGFDRLEKHLMQFIPAVNELNWEQINGKPVRSKQSSLPLSRT